MGRQRIHIDKLRTTDPRTLEILVQDAVRKPIAQISAATICDLIALSEVPDLPKSLARDFAGFAFRAGQEIADLPDGSPLRDLLDDLETIEPAKVPAALRGLVARESAAEGRETAARQRIVALVARWEAVTPETVKLGTVAPRIQRAEAVLPSDDPAPARRERAAKPTAARPAPKPRPVTDIDREKWLQDTILARLARYREAGLAEAVLVAGVQAEGRTASYADLAPFEVKRALEALASAGKVRRNVTRWAATMRHWQ